jgi:putative DNA modification/repair radical SAM protein
MNSIDDRLQHKLEILADAAKYDASCASSGAKGRNSRDGKGLGSTTGAGICHAYTPDGRCVSLLKILLTNHCVYDCAYCVNRVSGAGPRARFTVEEVVALTLGFYRRNMIEGLFLSSGIIRDEDYTMEALGRVARELRETHGFRGYIHLKAIAGADPRLIEEAGRHADRLSINTELVAEASLKRLAPEKDAGVIRRAMAGVRLKLEEAKPERGQRVKPPRFAPAGQSTQIIVGADATTDQEIVARGANLYSSYGLRRVYYSAFSPIPSPAAALPLKPAPLMREHRLYQADWLLRYYGFAPEEIFAGASPMLDLQLDPKRAWALRNPHLFPLDVNRAPRELLLRVPGLGVRVVDRLLAARRLGALRLDDVARVCLRIGAVRPFLTTPDWRPNGRETPETLARARPPQQLELFA